MKRGAVLLLALVPARAYGYTVANVILHVTGIPIYYEQFRLTIGVQYGA